MYSASQLYVLRDSTGPQEHGPGGQASPQALPRGAGMHGPSAAGTLHDTGGAPWEADPDGLRAGVLGPPVRQSPPPGDNALQVRPVAVMRACLRHERSFALLLLAFLMLQRAQLQISLMRRQATLWQPVSRP